MVAPKSVSAHKPPKSCALHRHTPRHCERSEAIQNPLRGDRLDCLVASAQNCFAILSRAPRNDGGESCRRRLSFKQAECEFGLALRDVLLHSWREGDQRMQKTTIACALGTAVVLCQLGISGAEARTRRAYVVREPQERLSSRRPCSGPRRGITTSFHAIVIAPKTTGSIRTARRWSRRGSAMRRGAGHIGGEGQGRRRT